MMEGWIIFKEILTKDLMNFFNNFFFPQSAIYSYPPSSLTILVHPGLIIQPHHHPGFSTVNPGQPSTDRTHYNRRQYGSPPSRRFFNRRLHGSTAIRPHPGPTINRFTPGDPSHQSSVSCFFKKRNFKARITKAD